MATINITDIADLCAGDIATFSYEGHEFTGEVWEGESGGLLVGATLVRDSNELPRHPISLVLATRKAALPTEPGAVIANVIASNGYHYDWAMLVDPMDGSGRKWIVSDADEYGPDQIVSWTPCTVEVQA